ncbi:MAG: hypothetical protein ABI777_13840, partial [Betaproteobacteria bacterium]
MPSSSRVVTAIALIFATVACASFSATTIAQPFAPKCTGGELAAGTGKNLEITGPCKVSGTVPNGEYNYGNINIYDGGSLTFADAK